MAMRDAQVLNAFLRSQYFIALLKTHTTVTTDNSRRHFVMQYCCELNIMMPFDCKKSTHRLEKKAVYLLMRMFLMLALRILQYNNMDNEM